jgi:two-component system nitrate/nitrite response regulator NarL
MSFAYQPRHCEDAHLGPAHNVPTVSRLPTTPDRSRRTQTALSRTRTSSTAVSGPTATCDSAPPTSHTLRDHAAPIKIVIADGHPVVREGLIRIIEDEDGLEVVGHAGDGVEAIALIRQLEPDILMLDHTVPQLASMEVLRELSRAGTTCRVIVMAAVLRPDEFLEALQLGAHGIVMKDSAMSLIVKSIRTVMAGQYWVGRESISDLVGYLRRGPAQRATVSPPSKVRFGLTRREMQIVSAVVAAYSNREIAEKLSLSEDTVKHHLSNIFDKLGLSNRLEVALFAINHQLVEGGAPVA